MRYSQLILACSFILSPGCGWGQNYQYTLAGDTVVHGYHQLLLSSDNAHLQVLGTINWANHFDIKVARVNPDLSVSWSVIYDGGWSDFAGAMVETPNGDLVVAGTSETAYATRHGFMMRITPNGDTLWTKHYMDYYGFNGLALIGNDTLIATGWLNNGDGCSLLMSTDGNVLWSVPGLLMADVRESQIAVRSDTLVVFGYVNTGNNTALYMGYYDISNNGLMISSWQYDWPSYDWPADMKLESDRTLIAFNSQSFPPPMASMVMSLDLDGNIQWIESYTDTSNYSPSSNYFSIARILDYSSGYLLAGWNGYYSGLAADSLPNIAFLSANAQFDSLSIQYFGTDSLESMKDALIWNGYVYGCGTLKSPSGIFDNLLFRIDTIAYFLSINQLHKENIHRVFPNPTSRYLWFDDSISTGDKIVMYDQWGRVVQVDHVHQVPYSMDLIGKSDGFYTLRVQHPVGSWSTRFLLRTEN